MSSDPSLKCPVDHSSSAQSSASSSKSDACPVDYTQRSTWASLLPSFSQPQAVPSSAVHPNSAPATLPVDRETSSIPKADGGNWVYPSQAQFYAAMARKNHDPRASDMKVIVPIHNAVNERAWAEVMKWEEGQGGERCGGVKLVSFKGRPTNRTPKAWLKTLIGYSAPFDRHDWVVDRCGTRMRYVIDFYTGHAPGLAMPSFYLDARPALDNWDGVKMRASRFWDRWVGSLWSSSPVPPAATTSTSRS